MTMLVDAQTRAVGVSVGNWFKYGSIEVAWSSNDPNATAPEFLKLLNETERELILIEGISGTLITTQITDHFKNGTESTSGGSIDVDIGTGNMTLMAISANLGQNDALYAFGPYSTWRINETITAVYPEGTRQTNHLNLTNQNLATNTYAYGSANYYWDKSTGILTELFAESVNQTGTYSTNWSMLLRLTGSDGWVIPELPSLLILPLFMIATLPAVIAYRKKHAKISGSL
jgi:hypothetical protein